LINGFRDNGIGFGGSWGVSLGENRISRTAIDENGEILGGIEEYNENVWELHPLVVRRNVQKRGIGRALVEDFEKTVKCAAARQSGAARTTKTNERASAELIYIRTCLKIYRI
jgi:GNAT superfamily N-acetyltransferase